MTTIAILFWTGVFLVFYTYLGYGILLWMLVKIREALRPARRHEVPAEAPEVTLLIAGRSNCWRPTPTRPFCTTHGAAARPRR